MPSVTVIKDAFKDAYIQAVRDRDQAEAKRLSKIHDALLMLRARDRQAARAEMVSAEATGQKDSCEELDGTLP